MQKDAVVLATLNADSHHGGMREGVYMSKCVR